ncbi:unnamed protein product, partial [Ectocarpus sp. 13 AM-2016]
PEGSDASPRQSKRPGCCTEVWVIPESRRSGRGKARAIARHHCCCCSCCRHRRPDYQRRCRLLWWKNGLQVYIPPSFRLSWCRRKVEVPRRVGKLGLGGSLVTLVPIEGPNPLQLL